MKFIIVIFAIIVSALALPFGGYGGHGGYGRRRGYGGYGGGGYGHRPHYGGGYGGFGGGFSGSSANGEMKLFSRFYRGILNLYFFYSCQ